MKIKKIIQIFWPPLIIFFLIIISIVLDFYLKNQNDNLKKLTQAKIKTLKEKNELLFTLENLEILAPNYEKYVNNVAIFKNNIETEAFLRDYFDKLIYSYGGKLLKCEVILPKSPSSVSIAQIFFLSEFNNYMQVIKLLKNLEDFPPVFVIKKVEIKKREKKIDLGVNCEFAYRL
ncbi:MAG: hypothetical protein LWW95_07715 [Candidatus Desulfofervidus auxilii]|nr:hypothetical protein [Candidatus Desulfofervidus auxilii]